MLTIPYTYLIGWPEHNRWYYGVRYAEGCNPSDLWVTYFTSSKDVAKFVLEHGEPTHKQIRKTFSDVMAARLWETKALKRLQVTKKEYWINKNDRMAPPILAGDLNPMRNPEIARKSGEAKKAKGIKKTAEWKANHSATMTGRTQTAEANEKRRQTMLALGDTHHSKSTAFKADRSKAMLANNPMARDDVRAKQSANRKGKPWSEARRAAQNNKKSKQ